MRRNPAGNRALSIERTATADRDGFPLALDPAFDRSLAAGTLLGLMTLAFLLALLLVPQFAHGAATDLGEPGRAMTSSAEDASLPPAMADPAHTRPSATSSAQRNPARSHTLEELLVVPTSRHNDSRSDAERADESIAAAVELGSNPDFVRPSAFRKRSADLFRTEREVEIGEQAMLLRLRLRAKSRETMSVELRF